MVIGRFRAEELAVESAYPGPTHRSATDRKAGAKGTKVGGAAGFPRAVYQEIAFLASVQFDIMLAWGT